ncbi:hypothetical protein K7432_009964 [Basidiobolus ranarum]|uniref:Uncharacterized protein n=1 Tax=Basidiobolus ranarum TaxID=34480 RepID=A0ABR2VW90_9FUNG
MPNNTVSQGKEKLFELKGSKSSDSFHKSFVNIPKGVFSASAPKDLGFKITTKESNSSNHQKKTFYNRNESSSSTHLSNFSHAIRENSTKDSRLPSPFSTQRLMKSSNRTLTKVDKNDSPQTAEENKRSALSPEQNNSDGSNTNEESVTKEIPMTRQYQSFSKPLFRTKMRDDSHQGEVHNIVQDTSKNIKKPTDQFLDSPATKSPPSQKQLRHNPLSNKEQNASQEFNLLHEQLHEYAKDDYQSPETEMELDKLQDQKKHFTLKEPRFQYQMSPLKNATISEYSSLDKKIIKNQDPGPWNIFLEGLHKCRAQESEHIEIIDKLRNELAEGNKVTAVQGTIIDTLEKRMAQFATLIGLQRVRCDRNYVRIETMRVNLKSYQIIIENIERYLREESGEKQNLLKKIESLEEELSHKQMEVNRLTDTVESIRKTYDEAACANKDKNDAITSERELLRIQLSKYQELIDRNQTEKSTLNDSMNQERQKVEDQRLESENQLGALSRELTTKSEEVQEQSLAFEKSKTDLTLQNQETTHLLKDAQNTIENLMKEKSAQLRQLEEELSYSRTRENEYKLTIQDMDRRVDSLQVSIEKNINNQESERRSWKQNTDRLEAQIKEYEKIISDINLQNESLSKELSEAKQRIESLLSTASQHKCEHEQLQNKAQKTISKLQEQIQGLKTKMNEDFISHESQAVENLKQELEVKESQFEKQRTITEKEIKSLEDQVKALNIKLKESERNYLENLEKLKAINGSSLEKLTKTEMDCKNIKSEYQNMCEKNEASTNEVAALRKENEELKKKFDQSEQQTVDTKLQQQAQQFEDFWRREESQLRNDLQKQSHQIENLVKELGNNQNEKLSLERALKDSQSSVETLKNLLETFGKQNGNQKVLSLSEISKVGGHSEHNGNEGVDTEKLDDMTLDVELKNEENQWTSPRKGPIDFQSRDAATDPLLDSVPKRRKITEGHHVLYQYVSKTKHQRPSVKIDDDIDFKSTMTKADKGKKEIRGKTRIPTRRSSRARTIKQSIRDKSGESSTEMTLFE